VSKCVCGWDSALDPTRGGELTALPNHLAGFGGREIVKVEWTGPGRKENEGKEAVEIREFASLASRGIHAPASLSPLKN